MVGLRLTFGFTTQKQQIVLTRKSPQCPIYLNKSLHDAPFDIFEKVIAAIWEDVLKVDRVGHYDSYFEHSGDSILAFVIVARIHDVLWIKIHLSAIFGYTVVESLTAYVPAQRLDKSVGVEVNSMQTQLEMHARR
jgi:hypothetical protein